MEPILKPSNVIDYYSSTANMYGCEPCPKCHSKMRYLMQDNKIHCDDCGYVEKAEFKNED